MDDKMKTLSTEIAEMKIIVSGADGFTLYPAKEETDEEKASMLHRHAHYEFFFSTITPVSIITEESEKSFFEKVVIIPPSLMHCCSGCGEGCYCMTVKGEAHARFFEHFSSDKITAIDLTDDMKFCLKKLVSADLSSGIGRTRAETVIKLLFLEIGESARVLEENSVNKNANEPDYETQIDAFINANFSNPKASVKMLAEKMYLSQKQVSRIVKKQYGCTFPELMNQKRMSVAVMLLKNTHLSVSEIAVRVGINNENYFYKLFKERCGVTPLKYRNLKIKTR